MSRRRRWPWQRESAPLEGLERADQLLEVAKSRECDTNAVLALRAKTRRENHIARAFGDALHIERPAHS